MERFWGHRKCDLVFDASSGNSTPLWSNFRVLSPGAHAVLFGFGSNRLTLNRECLQISGLRLLTSRGVGNVENRRAALALIRHGAADMIFDKLIKDAQKLEGLERAMAFIWTQHELSQDLYRAPKAYIAPNEFSPNQQSSTAPIAL